VKEFTSMLAFLHFTQPYPVPAPEYLK